MRLADWIGLLAAAMFLLAAHGVAEGADYALEFDGVDDYVSVPDTIAVTYPMTLEAWIRADFVDGRILSERGGNDGFELDLDSAGELRFTINSSVACSTDFLPYVGQWVHVAAVWEGLGDWTVRLYINGVPIQPWSQLEAMNPPTANLKIGCGNSYAGNYFDGAIDEVRIFDTAVAPETIAEWMHREISSEHPDFAHLKAAWSFNEGSGQSASSMVGSPGCDGRLGNDAGGDDADPAWIPSGAVATQAITWGRTKALYGR
jgi:hypothetical protein